MTRTTTLGALALGGVVVCLTLGTLVAVAWRAEGGAGGFGPADWAAIRFTLWQAALSAALSVALAVPVARALARRSFPPGRGGILITLLGAPSSCRSLLRFWVCWRSSGGLASSLRH